MLRIWQVGLLVLLGAALWALVTFNIRSHPEAALDEAKAVRGLLMAPLGGLVSVWLCKVVGRLAPEQILPGVAVVGASAMAMDGVALRWFPALYGYDEKVLRLSAADLLWGYGVGFAVALAWRWIALAKQAGSERAA